MANCSACHAELDATSLVQGRCPKCGATLRAMPKRKIKDIRDTLLQELKAPHTDEPSQPELETRDPLTAMEPRLDQNPDTTETIELSEEETTSQEGIVVDNVDTGDQNSKQPATVVLSNEQTVDFDTSELPVEGLEGDDVSDSMVTAQWLDNVAGSETDAGRTIKQKETVQGTWEQGSSSIIVKSRHFRESSETALPITSAANAPDYELINVIGEGGMGVVYAARQSSIARTVAIKMLKGNEEHTADQRAKFISEAVVTGELDHPNIVPIYDLGSNDSGALFYSMKRVRGTPWNDVFKETSLESNLNYLQRVADAIAFAHANGVLHRDLKPENVMLGDFGEVLVMDWGLARISDEFPSAEAVSQSDVMGGTPAYMAPEMATGPIEEITTASDIYLLGAILFEIITGKPPHSGKTVMGCLFAAAKNTIVETDETGELIEIALKAMSTKPADRYATVQDFQAALRLYQSHSESVLLTDSASKNLEAAILQDDYDLYSRSIYGFEEAISLWDGNQRAQELLVASRGAYAQAALDRSDFDLGILQLDSEEPMHSDLLKDLIAGRDERESRNRRLTLMKRAIAALLLAVVGIVSVSSVVVWRARNRAIVERDRADENYVKAEAAREVADKQRLRAEMEKERAEREEVRAKEQEAKAKAQEKIAVKAKQVAIAAEQVAVQAKQDEAYEAYVARIGLANAKITENAFDRAAELLTECDAELRHWEWGRLSQLCNLSNRTWEVDGPVEAIAISPDGKIFASGDWDNKARLWDMQTGELLLSIDLGQYVHAVAFDSAGRRLAVGSNDHTVRIYEVETGKLLQTLEGHTDAVLSVRFSADNQRLLTAGFDNTARLWDLSSGQLQQTLLGHSWWVWAAEFSADDQRIVTVSQDGKAIVWQHADQEKGQSGEYQLLTEFAKHSGPIYAAQFSPDGATIATAGHDRRVLLWNPDEVQPVDIARRLDKLTDPPAPFRVLAEHEGPVRTLAFSPDGSQLVSGGQDNVLRVWDLAADERRVVLRGHASHVRDCVFSPDGQLLLSAGRDQQIKLWQPGSYGESFVLGAGTHGKHVDAVLAARFSRDGKQIVTANRDRTATLWDTQTQTELQYFTEGHEFLASSSVFFADGARLATGGGDGTVRIWDVATGTQILELKGTGRTATLAVSPDGKWIATGSAGNDAIIWNTQTGEQAAVLAGHEESITAITFAAGGQMLATGDDLGRCRLWKPSDDAATWTNTHELRGHSRSISGMAFVAQDTRLITASGDNTCGQWDVATGKELTDRVLTHPDWITDMAVSADGTRLLTSCDDGVLRLWSLTDAKVLREIPAADEVVFTSVDLSSDSTRALAASAAKSTVQMWNLDTGDEIIPDDAIPNSGSAWLEFGDRAGILWAARFSPQGDRVLTIGGNDARLWDVASRETIVRFSPHGAVAAADISPDGKLLITGSWDQSAKIWDIATGKALRKLDGLHTGYVNSVEFSPNSEQILTGSDDGTARLWDVATGKPNSVVLRGHNARIRQARFSADGTRILTTGNDKTARIWDRQTGAVLQTLSGHDWAVLCGEFSRDGKRVITGSEDNTALIWDASTGEQLLKLSGHIDSITAVAFSPDGSRVMTASQDNTAKLWDAETGKEILTLVGHKQELTSVSFSPNGDAVLTSGRDGATILWPAASWNDGSNSPAN